MEVSRNYKTIMKNNLKISIGIPTCYGGKSLVETIKTLRKGALGANLEIIVEADRTPLTPEVKKALKDTRVKLHWNKVEGSQCKKLNQIIKKATGDIFIFTQDDIVFDNSTIKKILRAFERDKKLTMAGIRVSHLKPINYFESIMDVMLRVMENVAVSWNKGDNLFMASGRCLAFRTDFLKKFRINNTLINTDTFMYFENRSLKGKFKALTDAKVYIRPPQNLKDQIGPSSRYQYSIKELQKYFDFDISPEYKIPPAIFIKAAFKELLKNPAKFSLYILVYLYTRYKKQSKSKALTTLWSVDTSTKSGITG